MESRAAKSRNSRTSTVALLAAVATTASLTGALAGASAGHADGNALSTRTFESDPVGSVPAGCTTPSGRGAALVSDGQAYQGDHSLRVDDTSASSLIGVACPVPAQQGAYLSLRVYPAALPNGFIIDVDGDAEVDTGVASKGVDPKSVYHLVVDPTGAIRWYDGANGTFTWRPLAPAGTVPMGRWSLVELAIPGDESALHVTVNGQYAGSGGSTVGNNAKTHNGITDITGYGFTSDGTAAAGDDVYLDDITSGPAADAPAGSSGTPGFDVGATSVIDNVGQVQLPNTDVVVPHGNGKRILASYPAHSDSTSTAGNRMAYSDDGGATWIADQAADPMPDAPSFFMTVLRNGDILAVDYHTYMTPDSGNLKAEVDTAVSNDGGGTWTYRAGVMTAPQQMKPASSATDRPGSPAGGFVLVHSVVEDPDGTLYQSGYGFYAVDTKYRQIVMVSHDEGLTWTVASTVDTADPSKLTTAGYEGPCEGAIERVADGSLLMVMRNGSYLPMTYARSTDNGRTWSAPRQLAAGPANQPVYSVFPTMTLMPSGSLVLLVGRPGLSMLVSPDGSGNSWTTPVGIDYLNSENSAFAPLNASTVVVLGDRGRVSPWEVWSRVVTVDQPCAQTVTGTHDGPLTAGPGGLCLDGATVNGAVRVSAGGRLIASGSTVRGPVTASAASAVSLCGTSVAGPVSVSATGGNVAVGDTVRGCDPDTIAGPLSVSGSAGRVVVDRATVSGGVSLAGNQSPIASVLSGARVGGPVGCAGNAVAPTDSGVADTVAGPASGQCQSLG